jgi:hypothetical protein
MDTGHKFGVILLYCVMAGYAVLLLQMVVQIFFRAAIEKRSRRKWIEQNAQAAHTFRALAGKRSWANTWLPRSAEVNVAMQNDKVDARLAGAPLFVKHAIAVVSIFIALGVTSIVGAQQRPARDVSASDLKQQLIDVEVKETQLRIRLEELAEQLKPESIERELAGFGSVHPEELREHLRKRLTIERNGLQTQLDLLEERRAQIEAAIAAAETAAYLKYAQPSPTPPQNPMTEMAIINLPIKESLFAMAMLPLAAGGVMLLLIVGIKRMRLRHNLLLTLLFAQFVLPAPAPAQSQQTESITAFAKGHGSIVSAVEDRKFSAAFVVLRPNGQAVITLYSDLQLQVRGTWSVSDSSPEEIQLKITGGELGGNASGSGKVLLSNDKKNISELAITGKSSNGCDVTIRFTADRSDDSQKDANPVVVSRAAVAATTTVRARSEKIPLVIY